MEITIKNLARVVADVLGPDLAIEIAQQPLPAQNVARYVPSTERADKELGLRSWVTLEQGILRTVDWTKRTPSK